MRKTNWKILIFIWAPIFLLLQLLFGIGGMLGALIAYIPMFLIVKLLNLDMNVYYNKNGDKISKEEYKKIENPTDYGFTFWKKKKK